MAAASAIAEKSNRIENMFLNEDNELDARGAYAVNIYALGVPHTVIIDDYLPMYRYSDYYPPQTLFASVGYDSSLWGALLEKAFSKYHGNYKHTVGGNPLMAVRTLHGGPWEDLDHNE